MAFFRELAQILRRSGGPALLFLLIGTLNDQFINSRLEQAMMSDAGPGLSVAFLAAGSLLNSLLLPTLATVLLFHGLARFRGSLESYSDFLVRVPNQVYIETVRSWGSALGWGLLLILPGLIRLMQLLYVPLIVMFLKPYQEGRAEALKTSTRYAGKRPFRLAAYVLFFVLLIPVFVTSLTDPWRSYAGGPLGAFLCTVLDLVLLTLSVQVLFRLFDRVRQEVGDESLLPVERHSLSPAGSHV